MSPAAVDESELWQIAAILGYHRPPPEEIIVDPETAPGPPLRSQRGPRRRARRGLPIDTIEQRYLHAQDPEKYPKPEPKPASYNAVGFGIMGSAGRRGMSFGDEEVRPSAD